MSARLYRTGSSLALSASAGSGKTYALATRLVALLLGGAAPSEILAITFTKAAAGEIREKLFQRIEKLERGDPDEVRLFAGILDRPAAWVTRQASRVKLDLVRRFSLLHISTIHSFLLRVVRQFPLDTGFMDITVVDDLDMEEMIRRSIESFFARAARDRDLFEQVLIFLSAYREKRVTAYRTVRELYGSLDRQCHLLEGIGEFPAPGPAHRRFLEAAERLRAPEQRQAAENAAGIIREHLQRRGKNRNLQSVVSTLETYIRYQDVSALTESGPFRRYAAEGMIRYLERMLEALPRSTADRFTGCFHLVWRTLRDYLAAEMSYYLAVQLDIYRRIRGELDRRKRDLPAIDYTDIELLACGLLRSRGGGTVSQAIESGVRHLLIDEFQDTSELQWEALRPLVDYLLAQGGTLFYVGDVKQSIYRWRGGQPWLFDQVRRELGLEQARLPHSYRQNALLLDFVNRLFAWFAGRLEGRFRYLDQDLPPDAEKDRGYVHVARPADKDEVRAAVLEKIRELEAGGVGLGDIAVLCRSNQEVGDIEALLRSGRVPFSSAGRTRLQDDWCVRDLMGVMRFVLEPGERLHPWAVLRTPLFRTGFDLMDRLARRGELTLAGLRKNEPGLHRALQEMVDASRYASPSEFLRWLFGNLPVFDAYAGKEEVLLALYETAYRFENEREPATLAGFLRHLEERGDMLKTGASRGVSVQTIHSAKGLEFHTVVVPFLSAGYTCRLDGSSLLFSRDERRAVRALALPLKKYRDFSMDSELELMVNRHRDDYQVDEVNALYVALTRAGENLVLLPAAARTRRTVGDEVVEAVRSCFRPRELPWSAGSPVASGEGTGVRRRVYLRARPLPDARRDGRSTAATAGASPRDDQDDGDEGERPGGGILREGRLTGLVVHRALESLRVPLRESPEALVRRALAREGARFTSGERAQVRERAVSTLRGIVEDDRMARFLGPGSRAEMEVASRRYANLLGRVDRVLLGEVIEVLDFKTAAVRQGRDRNRLSARYREQVVAYCEVLEQVFPGREVRGYLYFTEARYEDRLMQVR